jgi:hypothetical protein
MALEGYNGTPTCSDGLYGTIFFGNSLNNRQQRSKSSEGLHCAIKTTFEDKYFLVS